jgi:hypothetical protein
MKHELDELLQQSGISENTLKHYGVKGMKWDESKRQEVVDDTIRGNYGNGEERKAQLGERYQEVQGMVNEQLRTGKPAQRPIQKNDVKKLKAKLKKKSLLERLKKFTDRKVKDIISKINS